MRRSFVLTTALAAVWVAIPSTPTVIAMASLATASLLVAADATAGTALLPGWGLSCGRDPRCFERGEYRRQLARLKTEPALTCVRPTRGRC
jgi:hypothetical protein